MSLFFWHCKHANHSAFQKGKDNTLSCLRLDHPKLEVKHGSKKQTAIPCVSSHSEVLHWRSNSHHLPSLHPPTYKVQASSLRASDNFF